MKQPGGSSLGETGNRPVPWLTGPSIYSHIKAHLDPVTGRLNADGVPLPDGDRRKTKIAFLKGPGAIEGNMLNFPLGTNPTAGQIASLVVKIASENSESAQLALYELALKDDLLTAIDPFIGAFARFGVSPYPYLYDYVTLLALNAPDRGPVKLAIALLGVIGNASDKDIISLVGRHEEFTLCSAVALTNLLENAETELWNLAQKVDGWGRIDLVRQLSTSTSPEIRRWLLRGGFRNHVFMYEDDDLAYECATGGDLKTALSAPTSEIDDELLDSTGEIIWALVNGGPTEGLDDYKDAAAVVSRYLDLLETRAATLEHFHGVASIVRYLASDNWNDEKSRSKRERNGWTGEVRTASQQKAQQIIHAPHWVAVIEKGLVSDDVHQLELAQGAAAVLGIPDIWQRVWPSLQKQPRDPKCWRQVMQRANADNIDQIIGLAAEELLPYQLATAEADALGWTRPFQDQIHSCMDSILYYLAEFSGKGWPLIAAGLKSPAAHSRIIALRTLASWGRGNWTAEIYQALSDAQIAEPRNDLKADIARVLRGDPA